MPLLIECYDVGGTKIRGALIEKGKIIAKKWEKTTTGKSDKLIKQIKNLSSSIREKAFSIGYSSSDIIAASFGFPGPVKNNIIDLRYCCDENKRLNMSSKLKSIVKKPVFVTNDMKAAVRAELKFGVGKKIKNFYLLTISTGIGSGLVYNGKVVEGFFGEFGHTVLERNPKYCNKSKCSKMGSWESFCGGFGIEKTIKKRLKRKLTVEGFFKSNDRKAKSIIKEIRDYNAHGIGNMLNVFSVDRVVVMGSIGLNQFSKIIPSKSEIEKYTINKIPKIVKTKLGDNIGLLGAYIFAIEELKK